MKTQTQTPRTYRLISVPADLADEVTAYLEEQRAGRRGLVVDFGDWARAELERGRERLVQERQASMLPPSPAVPRGRTS